jgi:Xaa-Pro aminopeptidase
LSQWRPHRLSSAPIPHAAEFRQRRDTVSKAFPGTALIIPTGAELTRANDTEFRFRPGTNFYYLTGNLEPDNVLVMVPQKDGTHRQILFVEPNPGRKDESFFASRHGELWVGPRLGIQQTQLKYGVDETRGLDELPGFLEQLEKQGTPRAHVAGIDPALDAKLGGESQADKDLNRTIAELRLIKSPYEVRELSKAIRATHHAFNDVLQTLRPNETERWVEGTFDRRAREEGNDVGYGTIAAAGQHATTLHWTRNDGKLKDGKMLLLDAGVEGKSIYTADVTRTVPVNGHYTAAERDIYDLVLKAQKAGIAEVKPGNSFRAPHEAAMKVLAEGLEKLGILKSAKEALEPENRFYARYTLHGVSHQLGLDVHDGEGSRNEVTRGPLQPGMVLTVEPGLYFQPDDLTVPEKYRGIGVRIEDDILVTPNGHRNLTAGFPHKAEAVERWMAKSQGRPAPTSPSKA